MAIKKKPTSKSHKHNHYANHFSEKSKGSTKLSAALRKGDLDTVADLTEKSKRSDKDNRHGRKFQ